MAKKGKGRRGGKRRQQSSNVSEYASMSVNETVLSTDPLSPKAFRSDVLYNKMNTNLSTYERAVQVAQAYQYYRIKKIRYTFKPAFDTFLDQVGSTTRTMKPTFYYMIDKSGSIPTTVNLEGLKQMGARGIALDEKPIHVSWAPSVLTAAGAGPGDVFVGTDYKIGPWLSTNADITSPTFAPSTVAHLGLYWVADQSLTPDKDFFYTVDVEVQFEFKKPIWQNVVGGDQQRVVSL